MRVPRTVLVGAGPAGAALAYLLARRGQRVTLVERQTDFEREFRGEVLMPSGIDAFRQMGLGDAFAALPQARPTLLDLHLDGRPPRRLALPDFVDPGPRMVSQPALLEMLIEQAGAFPGFRFLRGRTATDLLWEDGRVAGVALRGEGREELRADLVLGTDGRASVLRRKAELDADREDEAFDVIWFKVPLPPAPGSREAVQVFVRPGQACLAFPAFDERLQVAWIIPKGSYGDLKKRGIEAWLDRIAAQLGPELGAHVLGHREALEHPFVLDVVCFALERWHRPGLLLLGDACHPMSPVGGQGLNIALRDALVAANHLVPLLEKGGSPAELDAVAAAIQAERQPEVAEVQRLQRMLPRLLFRRGFGVRVLLALGSLALHLPRLQRRMRPPAVTRTFLDGVSRVELRV